MHIMKFGGSSVGTPERIRHVMRIIARPEAGILMTERSAKGVVDAVKSLFGARLPAREATRAYASAFSWDATTQGQIDLFRGIMAGRR